MKKLNILLIVAMTILMSCDLEPSSPTAPDEENKDYLTQTIYCTNYMVDVANGDIKINFSRSGGGEINEVQFASNNKNWQYEYLASDSLKTETPSIKMTDFAGKTYSEKQVELLNAKNYLLASYGIKDSVGVFAPDFNIVESNEELNENGESIVRFGHFHPSYDSLKIEISGTVMGLKFGDISNSLNVPSNINTAYLVYGKISGDYVLAYSSELEMTYQRNFIKVFASGGQYDDGNWTYEINEQN